MQEEPSSLSLSLCRRLFFGVFDVSLPRRVFNFSFTIEVTAALMSMTGADDLALIGPFPLFTLFVMSTENEAEPKLGKFSCRRSLALIN